MQTSEKAKELLMQWEGFKMQVYRDSAGLPTIGVGHLLTKDELTSGKIAISGEVIRYTNGLSREQVLDLLGQDLKGSEAAVNGAVKVTLRQDQFDALVAFVFNVGAGAFKNSTLLKVLNDGNYDQVPDQLRRWTRAGGQVVRGLVNRREHEISLWNDTI